jgi:iron complex outermembrane receptor protein
VPDNVTNIEFGWKTEWFERRLQFNAAIYQENWDNAQTGFFDPQGGLGNLAFATNGPSYRIRGFEPQIVTIPFPGLTFQLAASWNSTSQTNSPYLVNNCAPSTPGSSCTTTPSVNYGQPITSIPNPYGPIGSPTSYSPPFNMSSRIRYEWPLGEYNAFVQFGGQHQGHMVTATGYVVGYNIDPITTYDAAAGISKGPWAVQFFGQNITDVNQSLSTNSGQFIISEIPPRPRVLGIRFDYKFSEK